jgi:hypothetical protein
MVSHYKERHRDKQQTSLSARSDVEVATLMVKLAVSN